MPLEEQGGSEVLQLVFWLSSPAPFIIGYIAWTSLPRPSLLRMGLAFLLGCGGAGAALYGYGFLAVMLLAAAGASWVGDALD